ncbi:MAG: glycosyltransferase [Kiritimatiellae bacterium]|jgi:glycosyltransferase involved in cell wall biosynthesis|nr:glycosyltransferase [Kiritimatiellia bacterium]
MKTIHQIIAGYTSGDAISNEARYFRDLFRKNGFNSEIYCPQRNIGEKNKDAFDINECTPNKDDIVLLHLSIGSPANIYFKNLDCKKIILYHNVTPAHFFRFINEDTLSILEQGAKQVTQLAGSADINLADSKFNAKEISNLGYKDVSVLPIIIDFDKLTNTPNKQIVSKFTGDTKNILFVGRCAPNKKIEDLITAFYVYKKTVEPNSRLILAGSANGCERYFYLLKDYIAKLDLEDSVTLTGAVPQADLNAYYQVADLFLCMSEHEGFCIPLIEAMHSETPILAYEEAAVPETLDSASVTFKEKNYKQVAEMMRTLINETDIRNQVIKAQNQRLERLQNLNLEKQITEIVHQLEK